MSTSHDPILLISGAGLPSWIWDETRHELGDSHETRAAARPDQGVTARLGDYAEAAATSAPSGRFAIVAHSSGGVVGAEVARLLPERVTAFLAISAIVAKPGGSFVSAMPLARRLVLGAVLRLAGTRPPDNVLRHGLAGGLDADIAERIVADFVAESRGLYLDRTGSSPFTGPRGYVTTTRDGEIPLSLQRIFAQRFDTSWQEELSTGHLPMLEAPQPLASSIVRFLATTA